MSGKKTRGGGGGGGGGGDILFSHGSSAARGACILFSRKLNEIIHSTIIDTEGRYVIADIEIKGIRLTITNIYAPNDDNPTFFLNLSQKIEDLSNENQIIGGDFNLVLNIDMDKGGRQTTNFLPSGLFSGFICVSREDQKFWNIIWVWLWPFFHWTLLDGIWK